MIDSVRRYQSLRPTGLPWVPEAPAHWKLSPNKAHLAVRKVLVGQRHTEFVLLSLTKNGVIVRDISTGKGKFSSDMGTSQEVRRGDLVFCLFDVPETPRTIGLSNHDGMITGAYTVMECADPTVAAFLELFYKAMDDRKLLSPLYSGLRNTIPKNRLLGAKTPLPPHDEQAAIIKFLGHADRRIGRYIRTKQKLIILLEEQKQRIIHQAVTRGLNPNARISSSGIPWLRDVPEHWEVRRIKTLFHEVNMRTQTGKETLLSLRMYQGLVPHNEVSAKAIPQDALVGYKKVRPGQLVMNRMRAAIGIFGVPSQEGLVSPDYAIFEPAADADPHYYLSLFKIAAMCEEFRMASKGLGTGSSGFMRLYTDAFGVIWVPHPPLDEQAAITKGIEFSTAHVDRGIKLAQRQIGLLQEYRTRLVADVTTGKLDVRETAAKLPDLQANEPCLHDTFNGDRVDLGDESLEEAGP